jgi:hypothetical protein
MYISQPDGQGMGRQRMGTMMVLPLVPRCRKNGFDVSSFDLSMFDVSLFALMTLGYARTVK